MPEVGVYFVKPLFRDSIAASFMFSGVSKSGSPALKPITLTPSETKDLTLLVIDNVAEGFILFTTCDIDMLKTISIILKLSVKDFSLLKQLGVVNLYLFSCCFVIDIFVI